MALALQSKPFAAILNAVVNQVAAALGISTDFIRPVASDEYAVTEAEDLFAYLRPYAPYPCDGNGNALPNGGAGRLSRMVARRIRVYVWTRSGVDTYGGDEIALMGADPSQTVNTPPEMPGQFAAEDILLNALDDFMPVTTTNPVTGLTIGPVHWVPSEGGPPLRKAKNEEGLVWSALDFQLVYIQSQNTTEPGPAA